MNEELEFQLGYLERKIREVENANLVLEEELEAALNEVQSLIELSEYQE